MLAAGGVGRGTDHCTAILYGIGGVLPANSNKGIANIADGNIGQLVREGSERLGIYACVCAGIAIAAG